MSKKATVPANTLIDHESRMSLEEYADLLETMATKLREKSTFTVALNEQEVEVKPTDPATVEIKYEQKGSKHSFELELEWIEGQTPGKMVIR